MIIGNRQNRLAVKTEEASKTYDANMQHKLDLTLKVKDSIHTVSTVNPLKYDDHYRIHPSICFGCLRGYIRQDWDHFIGSDHDLHEVRANWLELVFDLLIIAGLGNITIQVVESFEDLQPNRFVTLFISIFEFILFLFIWVELVIFDSQFVFTSLNDIILHFALMTSLLGMAYFTHLNINSFPNFLFFFGVCKFIFSIIYIKVSLIPRAKNWGIIFSILNFVQFITISLIAFALDSIPKENSQIDDSYIWLIILVIVDTFNLFQLLFPWTLFAFSTWYSRVRNQKIRQHSNMNNNNHNNDNNKNGKTINNYKNEKKNTNINSSINSNRSNNNNEEEKDEFPNNYNHKVAVTRVCCCVCTMDNCNYISDSQFENKENENVNVTENARNINENDNKFENDSDMIVGTSDKSLPILDQSKMKVKYIDINIGNQNNDSCLRSFCTCTCNMSGTFCRKFDHFGKSMPIPVNITHVIDRASAFITFVIGGSIVSLITINKDITPNYSDFAFITASFAALGYLSFLYFYYQPDIEKNVIQHDKQYHALQRSMKYITLWGIGHFLLAISVFSLGIGVGIVNLFLNGQIDEKTHRKDQFISNALPCWSLTIATGSIYLIRYSHYQVNEELIGVIVAKMLILIVMGILPVVTWKQHVSTGIFCLILTVLLLLTLMLDQIKGGMKNPRLLQMEKSQRDALLYSVRNHVNDNIN